MRSVSEIAAKLGVEKSGRISNAVGQLVEAGFAAPDAGRNPETGADIREVRYRLHLTQSALAVRLDTNQTTISMIERGVKEPRQELVDKLKALDE